MNKNVFCLGMLVLTLVMLSPEALGVHVRGYYRKDGTYVRPHERGGASSSPAPTVSRPRGGWSSYSPSVSGQTPVSLPWGHRLNTVTSGTNSSSGLSSGGGIISTGGTTNMMSIASDTSWIERVNVEEGVQDWNEKEKATLSRMEEIHRSILVYKDSAQCLPGTLELLEIMLTTGTVPKLRDAWSQRFSYATEGCNYLIISAGNDQRQGTDDDLIMIFVNGVKRKGKVHLERVGGEKVTREGADHSL